METLAILSMLLLSQAEGKAAAPLRLDRDSNLVFIEAQVALREGPLELLLCPTRMKEHESILAAEIEPRAMQLQLLLAGAEPGRPASFAPYRPPTGQRLKIWVVIEANGKRQFLDARQWVRDTKTQKALTADFVFAGSGFARAPGAERAIFLADDGDLVCVANFPGSIVDIAQESSRENADRLFVAWTERIPPREAKVRVIIEPLLE